MSAKPEMKVLGGRNLLSQWERFNRLQRRSHLLLGKSISPKGVFRFKTYEEFNEWKDNHRFHAPPKKTT